MKRRVSSSVSCPDELEIGAVIGSGVGSGLAEQDDPVELSQDAAAILFELQIR